MRNTRREFVTLAGLSLVSGNSSQAAPKSRPASTRFSGTYAVPGTSKARFRSALNGVEYELYVRVPFSYGQTNKRYPVIWLLDADYSFAIASNHLEHLADRQHVPEHIIVAVAYPDVSGDQDRYRRERSRDYTPIFWPDDGYGTEFQKFSGGGPAFLRMIEQEAMPLVERNFRVDNEHRTLSGHSYGGLFASWVLQTRPQLFSRYLIVSPSLWYANGWMLDRERIREYAPLSRETKVWIAAGNWEQQASHGRMVTDVVQFAKLLNDRHDRQLTAKHRIFADETHASIWPAAFSTGMRHLYPTDWLRDAPTRFLEPCPPLI